MYYLGLTLVVIGLALIVFGFLALRSGGGTRSDYGGVIIIGPIPIVFAKNKNIAVYLLILAIILILLFYLIPVLTGR